MAAKNIFNELAEIVGEENLVTDTDILEKYSKDLSSCPATIPVAIIRPESINAVSKILKLCQKRHTSLIIQGGRTGLCGGATPKPHEIVLSLEKLNRIINIDPSGLSISVEAGATLQQVQEAAETKNLQFSLDLGARGTCTIGGNAATNAGGNRVVKYGVMRDLILDLEAVLPNGDIIGGKNSMLKDNAGYDLKQLLIGTEGTLGVITSLTLKLHAKQSATVVALCAGNSLADIINLLAFLKKRSDGRMSSFEVMWDNYFEYTISMIEKIKRPFTERYPIYALVEFQGQDLDSLNTMCETLLAEFLESEQILDVVISQSISDSKKLWAIREAIGDLLPELKPCANFDIGIPLNKIDTFLSNVDTLLSSQFPDSSVITFGHLGDGNLHLTIHNPLDTKLHQIESSILKIVGEFCGSISGEHGIGVMKKPYLKHSKTSIEINTMKALKKTFDQNNILNPGRVFDISP